MDPKPDTLLTETEANPPGENLPTPAPAEPQEPTTMEKLRGLPWGISFDIANTVFVQFTFFGSAFLLFLDDLGLNKTQIGLLLSFMPFLGLISLLVAPLVARLGYKRTFLTFFALRSSFAAGLLLTPALVVQFGPQVVLLYVAAITMAFSVVRAVAMTAFLPWQQEYIPANIRGQYSAYSNIAVNITGLVAVAIAGFVLGQDPELARYVILIAIGVLFGFLSVGVAAHIPGGARQGEVKTRFRGSSPFHTLKDRSFSKYLAGISVFSLGTGMVFTFIPLFMQEIIGLPAAQVVWLQTGVLVGGLAFSYVWGWMADRYGSRPVMLSGLFLNALLPVCWLLMPRVSGASLPVALGIAFLQGVASVGWGIGSGRLLYVNIVPVEQKSRYLSVYQAWIGIVGGTSSLLSGRALDVLSGLDTWVFGIQVNAYTVLFLTGFVLLVLSTMVLSRMKSEGELGVRQFAALFFNGNPVMAAESLLRFYRAPDEPAAITVIERLGEAHSPLTIDELLATLQDPRFYVRFEAIVSITRSTPDPRLQAALVEILQGNDPALAVISAWALGRMGDPAGIEPLRWAFQHSTYRSVRAHVARSLGSLGDRESIPVLLQTLEDESDPGLRLACFAALGVLQACEVIPALLEQLGRERNRYAQQELALAVARLVGDETAYIRLLRRVQRDPGTALAQELDSVLRKGTVFTAAELAEQTKEVEEFFAREELEMAARRFAGLLEALTLEGFSDWRRITLKNSAAWLAHFGAGRIEYLVLAMNILNAGP